MKSHKYEHTLIFPGWSDLESLNEVIKVVCAVMSRHLFPASSNYGHYTYFNFADGNINIDFWTDDRALFVLFTDKYLTIHAEILTGFVALRLEGKG